MRISTFVTRVFACAMVSVVAGCANGVPGSGTGVPSISRTPRVRQSWMAPGAASGDLLYVSDDGSGVVFIYSYNPPAMKFVGFLSVPGGPGPMCVDKQQNIWILGVRDGASYVATEYAHGGTSPINALMDPAGPPSGCAIDPTTGNLAISSTPLTPGQIPTIAIFHHERGKPTLYKNSSIPGFYDCCTYDHQGNLYGYGTQNGSGNTTIEELPKGSSSFIGIPLHAEISWLYGMQWVGRYLTIADNNDQEAQIDEYDFTASGAKRVKAIKLPGTTLLWQYLIDGNRVIAPSWPFGGPGSVGVYDFPSGGKAIRSLEFSEPVAVVVSRAPH